MHLSMGKMFATRTQVTRKGHRNLLMGHLNPLQSRYEALAQGSTLPDVSQRSGPTADGTPLLLLLLRRECVLYNAPGLILGLKPGKM